MSYKGNMYRSYFLKNDFYAKKGTTNGAGVFIRHDERGGIYALIQSGERKGVKLIVDRQEYFFDNFDKLDTFLNQLQHRQEDFMKILKRKDLSRRLRMLEI